MSSDPAKKELLLTSGSPAKRIVLFALPFFAGDLFHVFYTMIDAFIIGRWLGINGLAALGASMSLIWFVYGFCFGLTDGFSVITAQRVGAVGTSSGGINSDETSSGGEKGIRSSVATALSLCFLISIVLTGLLLPLLRPVLSLMRTPGEIINDSYIYALVTLSGVGFLIFSQMLAGIIRAGGNSFSPMVFFVVGTVLKILLVALFVIIIPWGIRGAALATVLADLIVTLMALCFLIRRFPRFIPKREDWRPNLSEYWIHFSLGISLAFMRTIIEIGNIFVQTAINGLGALTIAAVSAAQRVRGLSIIPLFSISRAISIYMAQNYGAGKIDRVYKGLFQICFVCVGLGLFMAVLNQAVGGSIVSLFLEDNQAAIALATQYILINGYMVFILGIMLSFRCTLQGLGMKSAPILCGIMESLSCIFAAFVLIPRLDFIAVCFVSPLAWLTSGIPLYIAFGLWKGKQSISLNVSSD